MRLIKPTLKYKTSFQRGLKEFLKIDKRNQEGHGNEGDPAKIEEYIKKSRCYERGVNLPKGIVPASTFWLIDKGIFIGRVGIRHKLNKKLRGFGGHIGYAIRPSKRNRGYGSKILRLALQKAKQLGLKKALVTCDDTNIASQKIIEKNGGKLRRKKKWEKKLMRFYWIEL
ncbi:MAG: GNAT family N-acetyltransferase [Candidatus Magasanikbacteria bacterium]|nr:GNAT family N-acetyltransferase [Candidatus Magasanikbacteria bacterium]